MKRAFVRSIEIIGEASKKILDMIVGGESESGTLTFSLLLAWIRILLD